MFLQNYLVDYTADIQSGKWTVLADYSKTEGYSGTLHGGGNTTIVTLSAAQLAGADTVYIRIRDCNPQDGWGGTISSLSIRYQRYEDETPLTVEDFAKKSDKDEEDTPKIDVSAFEPLNVDYGSKYKNRQKATFNIHSGSKEDADLIHKDTSAANATCKYTDLANELIYRIDLNEYENAVVVATVMQNYMLQVSADGKSWTTVQNYEAVKGSRIEGNGNKATVGMAAEKYAADSEYLYIRLSNSDVTTGWGGAISKLEIYYE